MLRYVVCLFFAVSLVAPASGIEIATGRMLGPPYDLRAFYVRQKGSDPWRKTYAGRQYRPEAAGRLMNLRLAQALFHDEWLTEFPFDPDTHTDRFISALDAYREHGILCISVSLQGGNMQYDWNKLVNRDRPNKLGPGKGSLVSAFRPNGSLKPHWMQRLLRLQRELDKRGMVLGLQYFYGYQDEVLENVAAIDRAVINITDWLIANDCRNVIIEIANEYNGNSFDHDRYIFNNMDKLIALARSRFAENKAQFALPISASTSGQEMPVFDNVRSTEDLVVIHGNDAPPADKRVRVAELYADQSMPGPIYMNEDNNGRETTRTHLENELASADAVFESGGSWGYMPWVQTQVFPFPHVLPASSFDVVDSDKLEMRDPAYFHAVLEHLRKLLETPASASRPCKLSGAR